MPVTAEPDMAMSITIDFTSTPVWVLIFCWPGKSNKRIILIHVYSTAIINMHSISRHWQSSKEAGYREIPRKLAGSLPAWHPSSLSLRTWIFPFTSIVAPWQPRLRKAEMWSRRATPPFLLQGQQDLSLPGTVVMAKVRKSLSKGNSTAPNGSLGEGFMTEPAQAQFAEECFMLYLLVGCSAVLFNCLVCFPTSSPSQASQGTPFWQSLKYHPKESPWELKTHYNQQKLVQKVSKQGFFCKLWYLIFIPVFSLSRYSLEKTTPIISSLATQNMSTQVTHMWIYIHSSWLKSDGFWSRVCLPQSTFTCYMMCKRMKIIWERQMIPVSY